MRSYYLIITNKERNKWLPVKKNRNATSVELTNKKPPRLFDSRGAALQAIRWWKEGISYTHYYTDRDTGYDNIEIRTRGRKEREEIELEIVEVAIYEVPF